MKVKADTLAYTDAKHMVSNVLQNVINVLDGVSYDVRERP
jgi:hypothetical protein